MATTNEHKRAWRIRIKIKKNKATPTDLDWLRVYESEKVNQPGDPIPEDPAEDTESPDDEIPPVEETQPEPVTEPSAAPPKPPESPVTAPPTPAPAPKVARPKPPPLPRIPSVEIDDAPKGKDAIAKWQDKYKGQTGQADIGREATCQLIGKPWLDLLTHIAKEMKDCGVDPIIDPEMLWGSIVLSIDQMLPTTVKLTPQIVAAGGSTAILAQRFIQRKTIKTALDKKKAMAAHNDTIVDLRQRQEKEREQAETARLAAAASAALKAKAKEESPVQIVKDAPVHEVAPPVDMSSPDTVF